MLSSYGIRKDATIEVKMRGRGGMWGMPPALRAFVGSNGTGDSDGTGGSDVAALYDLLKKEAGKGAVTTCARR